MRNLIIICLWALLLMSFGRTSDAQSLSEIDRQKLNNFQADVLTCSMFYKISAEGFKKNGASASAKLIAMAEQQSGQTWDLAYKISKKIGMTGEAFQARTEMIVNTLMTEMNDDFVNYSVLMKKHLKPCNDMYSVAFGS